MISQQGSIGDTIKKNDGRPVYLTLHDIQRLYYHNDLQSATV